MQGKLILKDGTEYKGESFGAEISSSGEVVFNTGMAGYPESLTDPSYFGQILVLTYPIIGNYGVPPREFFESRKIWIRGLIVQNYIDKPSHFESLKTLGSWLILWCPQLICGEVFGIHNYPQLSLKYPQIVESTKLWIHNFLTKFSISSYLVYGRGNA